MRHISGSEPTGRGPAGGQGGAEGRRGDFGDPDEFTGMKTMRGSREASWTLKAH